MPRTKEQNEAIKAEKRKIIMDAALELFAEGGYARTSIDMIAKHAKVAKGLIYTYFESKEDLLCQILASWRYRHPGNAFRADMTPEEFIAEMESFIENMMQHKDFYKLYAALGTQPSVTKKLAVSVENQEMQEAFLKFYQNQFGESALKELFLMSAFFKGFSMYLLFSEGQSLFPPDTLNMLKKTIIDFIKERFNKNN